MLAGLAPRLEKLDLQWHGGLPSMAWLLRLRSLQSLEVDAEWVEVDVPLAPLTHLTRMTVGAAAAPLTLLLQQRVRRWRRAMLCPCCLRKAAG